jgi:hypothetical protein
MKITPADSSASMIARKVDARGSVRPDSIKLTPLAEAQADMTTRIYPENCLHILKTHVNQKCLENWGGSIMKSAAFAILTIFGLFLANTASATSHPRPCTYLRDVCKSANPAPICDKAYQDGVAHNGAWSGPLYDRLRNESATVATNCSL